MFGHGCPVDPDFGGADFCAGAEPLGVEVVGVVDSAVVAALLVVPLVVVLGAAAAPAMPATAPVVASAPATIVALSSLDTVMG
jgi:hypothetical protein